MQYKRHRVDGVQVWTHRWNWEQVHGPIPKGMHIDHINGDKHDNRIENLRCVTPRQNSYNSVVHSQSKTGVKGLVFDKRKPRWKCEVIANGERTSKVFPVSKRAEAEQWLVETRLKLHGEYAVDARACSMAN